MNGLGCASDWISAAERHKAAVTVLVLVEVVIAVKTIIPLLQLVAISSEQRTVQLAVQLTLD